MRIPTAGGWAVTVARVDRRRLDDLIKPAPQPPTRTVTSWGGVAEEVPVYDDPAYQRALFAYRRDYHRARLALIAEGLSYPAAQQARIDALVAVFRNQDPRLLCLQYVLGNNDRQKVVQGILYLSTVTQRGINEAVAKLDYTWRGRPLLEWGTGGAPGRRGQLAVDFRAATRSGLTWGEFCDLPGPEQSMHVAYWTLEDHLGYLLQKG